MKHGSLFSGIGGFDLAAEWMGWENVFHCENNKFCQRILKHYWPNAKSYGDIKETDFTEWKGNVDIISGGFPCQPYSVAGKRKGTADDRHLWPEMLRAIREIQPRWVVGENVPGLLNWGSGLVLDEIKHGLESAGFEVFPPLILPAAGVELDHIRERVWLVAHYGEMGRENLQSNIKASSNEAKYSEGNWQTTTRRIKETNELDSSCNTFLRFREVYGQPAIFNVDDGFSFELDGITIPKWIEDSISAAGNAVVPQVVYEIFKAIEKVNETA